ncbi:hypothetical protein LEP1GSC198_0037 [Leptospira kirschneri str. JB]|nr:hypothetical protein LEP1GSC198_0037 [Leptospira kirschneri str. JB]
MFQNLECEILLKKPNNSKFDAISRGLLFLKKLPVNFLVLFLYVRVDKSCFSVKH